MTLIALIVKRHEAPVNFYLLTAFVSPYFCVSLLALSCSHSLQTLMEGLSLGAVVTYFDLDLVIKAFVITTTVFLALTVYTMQSKYDFSTWGAR